MPHFDGLKVVDLTKRHAPHVPFVFVSGTIGEEVAIESLKRGATDYILKHNMGRLATAVARAIQDSRDRAMQERIRGELRAVQEQFALFMKHMPGPACIKDLEGRNQFVNDAFAAMANRSEESLIGRTDRDLWPDHTDVHAANDRWVVEHSRALQAFELRPSGRGDFAVLPGSQVPRFRTPRVALWRSEQWESISRPVWSQNRSWLGSAASTRSLAASTPQPYGPATCRRCFGTHAMWPWSMEAFLPRG